eukprot:TRINITY_DN56738_c0_g1_i1.p1 TRINITY_DN56738_c0_g1~~TRINITY_DN56738_c0_g1_i1.p1  ORF type:complete len:203 (+),score=70.53 TRINITY_DN56738_c0_g1_i1:91-609(+)
MGGKHGELQLSDPTFISTILMLVLSLVGFVYFLFQVACSDDRWDQIIDEDGNEIDLRKVRREARERQLDMLRRQALLERAAPAAGHGAADGAAPSGDDGAGGTPEGSPPPSPSTGPEAAAKARVDANEGAQAAQCQESPPAGSDKSTGAVRGGQAEEAAGALRKRRTARVAE